jgi:mono/diheme cytochrome c family protein
MGGRFTQTQADDRGIFAAVDMRTNRIAWRQQWREICYSGSVVTAGGLVFVGRSDGRLTALDSRNGRLLWEFMTDAGVNTTVTTFERNGEQRVVVHAGGGTFANATRGDGIWMFSLSGTMNSLPPRSGNVAAGRTRVPATAPDSGQGNPERGAEIYAQACIACHGSAGDGGHGGGPTLIDGLDAVTIEAVTAAGRNTMPGFGAVYSAQELRHLSSYILQRLASP